MKVNYSIDGNKVCAVLEDFKDLQESPAGFGDSIQDAFIALVLNVGIPKITPTDWEAVWLKIDLENAS